MTTIRMAAVGVAMVDDAAWQRNGWIFSFYFFFFFLARHIFWFEWCGSILVLIVMKLVMTSLMVLFWVMVWVFHYCDWVWWLLNYVFLFFNDNAGAIGMGCIRCSVTWWCGDGALCCGFSGSVDGSRLLRPLLWCGNSDESLICAHRWHGGRVRPCDVCVACSHCPSCSDSRGVLVSYIVRVGCRIICRHRRWAWW